MKTPRYHCIMDISEANEHIANVEVVREFLVKMAAAVHMTILAGPVVVEGVPENPGITGFAVVDYSHISVHTFTNHREAMIDVFSCKPYEREVMKKLCLETFGEGGSVAREQEVHWG